MPSYKHVLFATDLTDENHHIVQKVQKLVESYGAKLSLVHVVEHLAAIAYSYMGSVDVEEQLLEEAKKQMAKLAGEMGVDEKDTYVEVGHPKTEILEVAKTVKADLIMVGSHGRSGITAIIGSTTNAIIHGAECDVLVVRAK
ncbi:MAG: universal stress protein UspA [Legionellaceae bacterium]|nr:universal stress protein UspA [Legionellaceae bacterium]|tara:strand:- start:44 stop:469 length:426 start_codon:yes stop_codon:yes gene_type:complete